MQLQNKHVDFPWLMPFYDRLTHYYQAPYLTQGLLLQIMKGVGYGRLITQLIQWILCQTPNTFLACGNCHSCRLMQAGTHADYHLVKMEETKKTISIEQIRNINQKVYETAQQGQRKVIYIEHIHHLTDAASNALLKTLEEPPNGTLFIFSCDDIGKIKATIRSRCLIEQLPSPPLAEGMEWLMTQTSSFSKNQLITALRLNQNAPIAALEMLTTTTWQARLDFCVLLQSSFINGVYFSLLESLKSEYTELFLNVLIQLINDAIKYQKQLTSYIVNRDQASLIHQLAKLTIEQLWQQYKLIHKTYRYFMSGNSLNIELLMADFLLNMESIHQQYLAKQSNQNHS